MSDKPQGQDDFTLEAILAEYKGAAFIQGDKKTSKEELDRKAEQILAETLREVQNEAPGEATSVLSYTPPVIDEPIRPLTPVILPEEIFPPPAAEPTIQLPKVDLPEAEFITPAPAQPIEETIQLPKVDVAEVEEFVFPVFQEASEETIQLPTVTPVELSTPVPTRLPTGQAIPEQVVEPVRRQKLEPGQVVSIPFPASSEREFASDITSAAGREGDAYAYADQTRVEEFAARLEEVEAELSEPEEDNSSLLSRITNFLRPRGKREDLDAHELDGRYDDADLLPDNLRPQQAAGRYGRGLGGYQLRGMGAILLALLMLLFTGLGDAGWNLPWFLSTIGGLTAALLILQLFAMFLTAEVLTTGVLDIFRRRMGAETLVTIAALVSILDAIRVLQVGVTDRALPYAAVVTFALGAALLGIKSTRTAMKISLRAAVIGSNPYVVTSKWDETKGEYTLSKAKGELEGFVRKTEQIDFSEYAYSIVTPLLLVMSAVFALLAAFGGEGELTFWNVLHYFSAMTLISASFTALMAYGVPYAMLARKLAKVGAAIAGWGGAMEVTAAKGLIITDKDVFPTGTMSLSGVKILLASDAEQERVLVYTSSLIIEAKSGLAEVFEDILRKEELDAIPVDDLVCYDSGGIGAKIGHEDVIVGCASFMNLMGVRLPQELNLKNAVFVAMNGELVGVFAINYAPQASVMDALVSLLQTKIKPLFAVRDFNITPMMLQNKFHITTDKIDFLTYEERYELSKQEPDERARPFAVLHREGLRPLADVIIGGKRLRSAVIRNTILSIASSVIGLVFLLSFFWTDAAEVASSVNLFYYMAAWLFALTILSRTVTLD
ncbi:MAG: hypothetical protein FWE12_05880 [Oscillospiraceae bacterium]|nr:hypothetical protein [Oscillospiraceae bacterium]